MSNQRITLSLRDLKSAKPQLSQAWAWIKEQLSAGYRLKLTVERETRSVEQNGLLHSRISDIAKHIEWAGSKRSAETWKRLLTASWMRTQGESIEILPALDGHGIDVVFRHTSQLTVAECIELSDYIMAWGDEKQVPWCRASLGRDAPECAFE